MDEADGVFTLSEEGTAAANGIFAAVELARERPDLASELLRDPVYHEDEDD